MKKLLIAALIAVASMPALANDTTESDQVKSPSTGDITFTIPQGYKYFRINCGNHSIKHSRKYTISADKKLLTFVEDDDGWMQFVNEGCMISLYKG